MSFIKEVSIGNNVYDIRDKNALNTGNISNCLLEIPQDIKLELVDGTLTLKAGSKVYVPNGFESDGTTPKFDVVITPSDATWTGGWGNQQFLVYLAPNNILTIRELNTTESGSASTLTSQYRSWYDTSNNIVKWTDNTGSTWNGEFSFPLALVTTDNSSVTSIDQVFNGFGYIGSTVFALPGVKGLIPDGRNADGSLKNIEFITDKVLTYTFTSEIGAFTGYAAFQMEGSNFILSYDALNYWAYNGNKNIFEGQNETTGFCYISKITTDSTGKITSFIPKTAFHAVDYSDSSWLSGLGMPSNKYIDLTLGASGATYTAPANGYFNLSKEGNANQYVNLQVDNSLNLTFRSAGDVANIEAFYPCKKGAPVKIFYDATGNVNFFRFIYAEGEN